MGYALPGVIEDLSARPWYVLAEIVTLLLHWIMTDQKVRWTWYIAEYQM